MRLSQLVIDCPAVRELDINPLLADNNGVVALDARIRIEPREANQIGPNPRLAIRPYPNQWETSVKAGAACIFIRPIRPIDEHLYQGFIERLSPEDIRFRFLAPQKEFSHKFIARFTQIEEDPRSTVDAMARRIGRADQAEQSLILYRSIGERFP